MRKAWVCIPTVTRPYECCTESLTASIPLLQRAGWEVGVAYEVGCPYISAARQKMLRKGQAWNADAFVFIDHDLSWEPDALLRLLEAEGDVVAGTYRFKREPEEYMGSLFADVGNGNRPFVREDGCVRASFIPAGFLKITRAGLSRFMYHHPELQYVEEGVLTVDLFNHGVHQGIWYGEDYAFARRWNEKCGQIWVIPTLQLDHHTPDNVYPGNFHEYLLRQEGGSEYDNG
jgi:hypothetical protein